MNLINKKSILAACLAAFFSACGGGGSGDDYQASLQTANNNKSGVFIDSAVEGLHYETNSFSGITDIDGSFNYKTGEYVKFYIGDYFLGEAIGLSMLNPYSLYPDNEAAAIRVAQVLQTFDSDQNPSNGITLIEVEGFSALDDTLLPSDENFINEVESVLGVSLISAEQAQEHLNETLNYKEVINDTTPPEFVSVSNKSVLENQISALTLEARDNESTVHYSIVGKDAVHFNVDGTSGKVTFKVAPDYEVRSSYSFDAQASDENGNNRQQRVTINIVDIDETIPDAISPVFISQGDVFVNENQISALTLEATDNESNIIYAITSEDASSFNINAKSGEVTFKIAPDYESKNYYRFVALATDISGNVAHQDINIKIRNVDEYVPDTTAPLFTSTNVVNVNENQTSVLTLVAIDTESSVMYSLTGTDAASFVVEGSSGLVIFKVAPDYETKNKYYFTANATDISGNKSTQNITVNVVDVDEISPDTTAPTFISAHEIDVNENQTSVLTVRAIDNESAVTYSILQGQDDSSFILNGNSGILSFKIAPDYETKSFYQITIAATDTSGNSTEQLLKIKVVDLDEYAADITPPTFTSTNSVNVNENQKSALELNAIDSVSDVTYTLSGTDVSSFIVDESSGLVTFKVAPDYETKNLYSITAIAKDASGNEATQAVIINIINLFEGNNDRSIVQTVNLTQLAQAQGKTNLQYLHDQFEATRPSAFVEEDKNIFTVDTYTKGNWASNFDFSGVSFDKPTSGTLVTDQHVMVACHFPRRIGEVIKFVAQDGTVVERHITALQSLEPFDSGLTDACVHKLDTPVPESIKVYKLVNGDTLGSSSAIVGAPYVRTDQFKKVFPVEMYSFNHVPNSYGLEDLVTFGKKDDLPSFMFQMGVGGDSGNPQFLIINGELVLGSVLFGFNYNQTMLGHFLGYASAQTALNQAINAMEGI